MCASTRWLATTVYFVSLACTLIGAFVLQSAIFTLIAVAFQFCAAVYYSASYVPFAREMLASCCKGCVKSSYKSATTSG